MSSNTQYELRPVVVSGGLGVALNRVLGAGGVKLVEETLDALIGGTSTIAAAVPPELRSQLAWERVDGATHEYQLRIRDTDVAEEARAQGITQVEAHLKVGESVAMLSYRCTMRGGAARTAVADSEVRKHVNRAVNRVLAVAATAHVRQKMATYVPQALQQKIETVVTRSFNIQTLARY